MGCRNLVRASSLLAQGRTQKARDKGRETRERRKGIEKNRREQKPMSRGRSQISPVARNPTP